MQQSLVLFNHVTSSWDTQLVARFRAMQNNHWKVLTALTVASSYTSWLPAQPPNSEPQQVAHRDLEVVTHVTLCAIIYHTGHSGGLAYALRECRLENLLKGKEDP